MTRQEALAVMVMLKTAYPTLGKYCVYIKSVEKGGHT